MPSHYLLFSVSAPSMWQRTVRPCCFDRVCTHKPEVSSSSSSPCSSPTPPCSSPRAAAGTPRRRPPGCATASACSSSFPPTRRKWTNTPRSGRTVSRGSGRRPSASKKVGNIDAAAPLGTPVEKTRSWLGKPHNVRQIVLSLSYRGVSLTQAVTMNSRAQRTGPSRFHRPLRSSCIDMAISRAPSKNTVYTQWRIQKQNISNNLRHLNIILILSKVWWHYVRIVIGGQCLTYLNVSLMRAMHRMVTQMEQTDPKKSQYCRVS